MEQMLVQKYSDHYGTRSEPTTTVVAGDQPVCRDSRYRSIAKSASYRIVGSLTTAAITWAVSGRFDVAAAVGLGDSLLKVALFYLHERAWDRIRFGRNQRPDS